MIRLKSSNMFIFVIFLFLPFVKGDGESLNCTFDHNFCSWKQEDSANLKWQRSTEDEPYIYIETGHNFSGGKGRITSSKQSQGPFCLSFLYRFKGMVLDLKVYMKTDDTDNNLILQKNTLNNYNWEKAVVGDISYADFQIIIEGVLEGGFQKDDIAVDDISITDGFCSTVSDCNFDYGLCNWVQEDNGDFYWHRRNTLPLRTEPLANHTSGHGHFIYIETNTTHRNKTARLVSPLMESDKYCFSLWYHMHCNDTGTLTVKKAEYQKEKTGIFEIFEISGNQDEKWIKKTVFIQSGTYFKVIIEGRVKDVVVPVQGHIAVDDVNIISCQDCGHPLQRNGQTNSSNFEYGSAIEATCDSGYKLTGPSTLICQSGGMWSATVKCEPADCENPQPRNGGTNSSNFRYGSAIQVICDSGYDLKGPPILTCQLGGTWSANVTCDPIDCENPQPRNGGTNSSNFRYGSAIQVICDSGYDLKGPPILTCQLGGTWSANVTCDPIECEDPTPENGVLNSTVFAYGSTVEITCSDGYKIKGESVIYCQANESWTAYPTCLHIDCLMPRIANGRMSRNYTTYNYTLDISCQDGYDLIGKGSIKCQTDGNWSTPPTCHFHRKVNIRALTVVYILIPLVAVAVGVTFIAIISRKKIIHYFTKRNVKRHNKEEQPQPGIVFTNCTYSGHFFEKPPNQEEYFPQIDAYAEIEFEADINTINETEHIYNHTSQPGTPVIDSTYSHFPRNNGISSSIYDTTTFSLSGNPSFQPSTNRKSKTYDFLNITKAKESCRLDLQRNIQDEQDCEYDHVQARETVPTYLGDYAHLNVLADNSRSKLKKDRLSNAYYTNLSERKEDGIVFSEGDECKYAYGQSMKCSKL